MQETIIILDFGSQYTQLIARKVRELNVYCEIHPYNHPPQLGEDVKGVILSGSPFSVSANDSPRVNYREYAGNRPVLGICFGAQMITQLNGGTVSSSNTREFGRANLQNVVSHALLQGLNDGDQVWMSHSDTIKVLPDTAKRLASTATVENAAFAMDDDRTYGVQFHPEVVHSVSGTALLKNFVADICGCSQDWTSEHFIDETVSRLKQQLKDDKVVLGLSGGVDSSVAAVLLHKAIGENLHCIFVNNGLLRKNEFQDVLESYKTLGLNVKGVDASALFYKALAGITDPEKKRKAIGATFIEVFDAEASSISGVKWLGQGTIYPDVIESVNVKGPSATIKSHHNVGGLPENMTLKVVEPLNSLFKDEVRAVGRALGIPENIIGRHPFPGPGLAIRILGDITPEKVYIVQEADHIFISELKAHNLYNEVWQAGVILLPVQSVGVMGDERTYENAVVLRAVQSTDGMTADWCHLPYPFLALVSNKIINQVTGINRVVYDISSKPPATIEWE